MLREVRLKILEVLGHRVLSTIFPLGNVHEVGYHLDGDLPFFLTLHLETDGLKVLGPQVLDREELHSPWIAAAMATQHPCGTTNVVFLRG